MTKTKILRSKHFLIWDYVVIINLEFCIKDWWFGLYWENKYDRNKEIDLNENISEIVLRLLDLYFIIIPTLPIHFIFYERIEKTTMSIKEIEKEWKKQLRESKGKIGELTNV